MKIVYNNLLIVFQQINTINEGYKSANLLQPVY